MDYSTYTACLSAYHRLEQSDDKKLYTRRYRQFLLQVFSADSVLQLVPNAAIQLLQKYSEGCPPDPRLQPLIPALGMIFLNAYHPINNQYSGMAELRLLSGTLAQRANVVFHHLVHDRETVIEPLQSSPPTLPRYWETTGCYYGRPAVRYRPYYEGRDSDKSVDTAESEVCRKFYSTYTKQSLTGGLMALWCPHLICLGFHKMPHAEGRNDIFSALFKYFEKVPETVIYDFACQLAPYCMSREPLFFKDTCFAVDEMHAKGHVGCSQASFMSNYMQVRPEVININTSAAECSNSGLSRIKKSISYMDQKHAILYTYVYLCVWNRRQERKHQSRLEKELLRIPQDM